MLARFRFPPPDMGHGDFHGFHVQQGFAAKKINFRILAAAAVFNQEVDGPAGDFRGHQASLMPERTGSRKAITAAEIAIMGDVQAERLNNRRRGKNRRNFHRGTEQHARVNQFMEFQ